MIQDIYPHDFKNSFIPGLKADDDSLIIHFDKDGKLLVNKHGKPFPRLSDLDERPQRLTYLFSMDEDNIFLAEDEQIKASDDYSHVRVRDFRRLKGVPKKSIFEAFTAKQLNSWYVNNRFCGRCATPTKKSDTERALVCPSCGNTIYPRVVPAVIVGVLDKENEKIILTKYNGRVTTNYALVAGFTEIGETFEETVAREVKEEVGLKVKNITYYKSQPWGVADDILAGFFCEVDGDRTITRDPDELSLAEWMSRDEVVLQPDDLSLTNEMMRLFKEGKI